MATQSEDEGISPDEAYRRSLGDARRPPTGIGEGAGDPCDRSRPEPYADFGNEASHGVETGANGDFVPEQRRLDHPYDPELDRAESGGDAPTRPGGAG